MVSSYNHRMSKQAVSVTLQPDNVLWLKTRVKAAGGRSLSEALDEIITKVRAGSGAAAEMIRSVVGNARIPRSEQALSEADEELSGLFRKSVRRKNGPIPRAGRKKSRRASTLRKRA